jgi:hypothetical protein
MIASGTLRIVRVELIQPFPHPRQRVQPSIEPRDPGRARMVQDGLDRFQGATERFRVRRSRVRRKSYIVKGSRCSSRAAVAGAHAAAIFSARPRRSPAAHDIVRVDRSFGLRPKLFLKGWPVGSHNARGTGWP